VLLLLINRVDAFKPAYGSLCDQIVMSSDGELHTIDVGCCAVHVGCCACMQCCAVECLQPLAGAVHIQCCACAVDAQIVDMETGRITISAMNASAEGIDWLMAPFLQFVHPSPQPPPASLVLEAFRQMDRILNGQP